LKERLGKTEFIYKTSTGYWKKQMEEEEINLSRRLCLWIEVLYYCDPAKASGRLTKEGTDKRRKRIVVLKVVSTRGTISPTVRCPVIIEKSSAISHLVLLLD
jgi:hypothetical protein